MEINEIQEFTELQKKVLKLLFNTTKNHRYLNRKQIVDALNYPRTTIYDNLLILKKLNIVNDYSDKHGEWGRPYIIWFITQYGLKYITENHLFH